ncbi:O-antigen ligase domain-containing protein [Thermocoleostomius sinensis]|uniref:O-antigen ligase domain-containing protein n=1 Tax=Thermocoleostomius sinensis A174 TaxID=2016057 RepID=A0A9E9C5P0_9CYAN|nr:O-antigen ligase domain-containing protein [Thermocoleostomius sinensis]WAL58384.1 O-antigen ligase domain-containing protein [Thermocoleostomius sinensis A174]
MHQQFSPSSNSVTSKSLQAQNQTKQAWQLIGAWSLFVALCLLAKGGKLLVPLLPFGSIVLGLFLYFRTPSLYVGYTWCYCFLGALIRRIIDYQSGYITPGRWGLISMLVSSICFITLVQQLPKAHRQGGLPFILSAISVIYAYVIGVAYRKIHLAYLVSIFEWLGPITFGFYLFSNWRLYPIYRQVTERVFVWGVLIMGIYGIFQFFVVPDWDRFYLENLSATSFGHPLPFKVRVFSTQSSPQSFASVMMAGLILLFGSSGSLRWPASGVGYLSFLLSMARSGWLGWAAGTVAYFPFLKLRLQMRFVLTLLIMVMLVAPLVNMEPFSAGINERLESLSDPQSDRSFEARSEGYSTILGLALSEFIGRGLGSTGPASSLGGGDSGIIPLLFSLGWFGLIPYMAGIVLIVFRVLQSGDGGRDSFVSATRAIVLGMLGQVWLNNIFSDVFALIFWGFLGIGMAASKYYAYYQKHL